jgi:hypothetical protein
MRGFDGEPQTDCLRDRDERGEPRVAAPGQRAVKAFPLDARCFRDLGNSLCLHEMAQRDEQNTGLIAIFQSGLQVLGGKIRIISKPSNHSFIMRNAGFAFHLLSLLAL